MRSKKFIIVGVVCLILGIICFLYYNKLASTNNLLGEITHIKISTPDKTKEIRVKYPEGDIVLYENNVEAKILNQKRRKLSEALMLNLDVVEGYNILDGKSPSSELTWDSTLEDSSRYIKYLLEEGYSIELEVNTPQFIEIYLRNDEVIKRVVVFKNSIMVADLKEGVDIPSFEEVCERYIKEVE